MRSVEECYRGRNVRVFRLDQSAVVVRLRERARTLIERCPDVLEVRLFGSLARGTARPGSDADLVVITRDGSGPAVGREVGGAFDAIGVGCEIVVLTASEARVARRRGDRFAHAVFTEGLTLATRLPESDRTPETP